MPSNYWIVNLNTREYYPVINEGSFFDGDWKQQTPWPETYIHLSAQKIYSDQVFQENVFYNYDLTSSGMIVGVYYDVTTIKEKDVKEHIKRLKRQHDVVRVNYHPLTLRGMPSAHKQDLDRLCELQRSLSIVHDSSTGFFDTWDIPTPLKAAIHNYQIMRDQLNEELRKHGIEEL